ncbi:DUF3570 domain-containing protein [Bermanella marisrubri]|uniref:DUF3570 domain-containing protein n=1 Tax=Bermanella marisrubri TaxID=207949 RepID=Q1N0V5_9GAMM|nr:DUF3570 domain-containing protein [Bermanella marisrubri]EAT11919.1 hypothetical protein RED65_14197 [Oceanobacter sp. RED65] [Bermanella marisrubri]QIZ83005.1 DUF3570 domain-containing protein [Bermanella marisrubri]
MAVTKKNIKQRIGAATAILLGQDAVAQDGELYNNWDVDLGYLRYEEPDKIEVDTYMAMINGDLSPTDSIKLGLVFDTLTGATPSGALPSNGGGGSTFTGVSGGQTSSGGGDTGLVEFDDTRLAFDATWTHEWHRLIRSNTSAYVSVEGDYTAVGGSLGIEKDTQDRAYTFTAAVGLATDKVGRSDETTPEPLSRTADAIFNGTGNKNTYDALLGITHVINKRTLAMLNYTYSTALGYHTDPYKIISVADINDNQLANGTLYESRPDERTRQILYTKLVHELPSTGNHFAISYRYHTDTWDLNSHTIESHYSKRLSNNHLIEPFWRIYHQQAANFYQRTIIYDPNTQSNLSEVELPEHVSSDSRLAELLSNTIGIKYRYKTSASGSIDLRAAYIYRDYSNTIVSDEGNYFVTLSFGKGFE